MKYLSPLLALFLCFSLMGCIKRPAGFVGAWQSGSDGLFSTKMVLVLKKDGSGSMTGSVSVLGSQRVDLQWEVDGETLVLFPADDAKRERGENWEIIAKSETEMAIRGPGKPEVWSFRRLPSE